MRSRWCAGLGVLVSLAPPAAFPQTQKEAPFARRDAAKARQAEDPRAVSHFERAMRERSELGLDDSFTFRPLNAATDARGGVHVRLQAYKDGLRVRNAVLISHADAHGFFRPYTDRLVRGITTSPTPKIDLAAALARVEREPAFTGHAQPPQGELVFFPVYERVLSATGKPVPRAASVPNHRLSAPTEINAADVERRLKAVHLAWEVRSVEKGKDQDFEAPPGLPGPRAGARPQRLHGRPLQPRLRLPGARRLPVHEGRGLHALPPVGDVRHHHRHRGPAHLRGPGRRDGHRHRLPRPAQRHDQGGGRTVRRELRRGAEGHAYAGINVGTRAPGYPAGPSVTMEVEPNNTQEHAQLIPIPGVGSIPTGARVPAPRKVRIRGGGTDTDFYRFEVPYGGFLTARVRGDGLSVYDVDILNWYNLSAAGESIPGGYVQAHVAEIIGFGGPGGLETVLVRVRNVTPWVLPMYTLDIDIEPHP